MYVCQSVFLGCLAVIRLGITTIPPCSSNQRTNLSLSYPLSARTSLPLKSKGSNSACATQISLRFPLESKSAMDSQGQPLPHGLSWSSLPCSARLPRDIPFFSPTGVLVNLDRSAIQPQRCFVHQILLNQGCEDVFPYSGFSPSPKPTVYALPWAEPLQQIPPCLVWIL